MTLIRTTFAAVALSLASSALARTDLAGCTYTDLVVKPTQMAAYASRVWYVPDTGEVCELLDCGGGRAPPKSTVPGCPLYTGTETYTPSYINPKTLGNGGAEAGSSSVVAAATTPVLATATATATATVSESTSESTSASESESAAASESESGATASSSSATTEASITILTGINTSTLSKSAASTVGASSASSKSAAAASGSSSSSSSSSGGGGGGAATTTSASTAAGAMQTVGAVLGPCVVAAVAAAWA